MPAPQQLDRYEIQSVLGKGAMGQVFKAWDPKLQREVAIKLVTAAHAAQKSRERFHREVCAIAALRHPNVVEIYDYSGSESEHLYYVMEKLDGNDLFNVLQVNGPLPEVVVAAVGHELCLALTALHAIGIIHRDLKPENVFMSAVGRVVLTDFGVVKAVREDSAIAGFDAKTDIIGTPGFMSPELLSGQKLGPYTDVFALGSLLYNVLTGELPFSGASPVDVHRAILAGHIGDPRARNPLVSDELCECLESCLAAKPKDRPGTAEEVRLALKGVLDAHGVHDLRDELRDYTRDPKAYVTLSRDRVSRYLIERLKIALKDKDSAKAARLQRRLLHLDPNNAEIGGITGIVDVAKVRPSALEPRRRARLGFGAYAGAVLFGLAAVGLAVFLTLRPRGLPDQAPRLALPALVRVVVPAEEPSGDRPPIGAPPAATPAPQPAAAPQSAGAPSASTTPATAADARPKATSNVQAAPAAAPGVLQLRIKGGPAEVRVGTARLTRAELAGKRLPAGHYRVEVAGAGKRLAVEVDLKPAVKVVVSADLKRGRISAR